MSRYFGVLGAVSGALSVLLGAFGAHGLKNVLPPAELLERMAWWETASHYHLVHSVLLVVIGWMLDSQSAKSLRIAGAATTIGMVVFSGSLYLMTLTGVRWLGAITPIGGTALIVAWFSLAMAMPRSDGQAHS